MLISILTELTDNLESHEVPEEDVNDYKKDTLRQWKDLLLTELTIIPANREVEELTYLQWDLESYRDTDLIDRELAWTLWYFLKEQILQARIRNKGLNKNEMLRDPTQMERNLIEMYLGADPNSTRDVIERTGDNYATANNQMSDAREIFYGEWGDSPARWIWMQKALHHVGKHFEKENKPVIVAKIEAQKASLKDLL